MAIILSPSLRAAAAAAMMLATVSSGGTVLAQQRVGVNSAVNQNATGTPPNTAPRRLVIGQDVVYNERIQTENVGQTQILFVDQSSMSIGPSSDLVIDEFVFDPHTGTGKMAASITRGVFRFVGGQLSKNDNAVTMRTPSATIGIRGGVFLLNQQASGKLDVIFEYGQSVSVTGTNGQTQTMNRPGFQIEVNGPGAPPSAPQPAPPGSAASILVALDGRAGANGGATTIPTDATVESSGIGQTISGNMGPGSNASFGGPGGRQNPNSDAQTQNSTSTGDVGCDSTGQCINAGSSTGTGTGTPSGGTGTGTPSGGTAQPVSPGPATVPVAFAVQPDPTQQSAIPFIRSAAGGSLSNPSVSPLLLATPPGAAFAGTAPARTKALQASLAIDGQGSAQSSVIVVAVGNTLNGGASGQAALSGQVNGSFRATAASAPVVIRAPIGTATDNAGNSFFGSGSTISGFVVQNSGGAATETSYPGGQTASYGFAQPATATALPAGVGTAHTTQTQTGFFGGIMQPFGVAGAGTPYAVAGTATVATDANNYQVQGDFSGRDPFTSSTSGVNQLGVAFGTTVPGITRGRQAYIDDSHFAALESPLTPSQVNQVALTGNGDPLQGAHVYMVSGATVTPASGAPCQCQFLQWGYWGGQLNTGTAAGSDPTRVDIGHINTWVAGMPTAVSDLQTLAGSGVTGTYNGGLTGSVFNNGAQYLASGALRASYNFGTQAGSFAVTNYDGHSFTAPIPQGAQNGANYTFAVSQSGLSGTVNGSFYGPMAAETGGNFALSAGPAYVTSGIFAAKR